MTLAIARGILNDRIADVVLGQRSFAENCPWSPAIAARIDNPIGCLIDQEAVPEILYIIDGVYNRVLGYDWDGTTLDLTNPIVIGQPDEHGSNANGDSGWQTFPTLPLPSASTLQLCPIMSQSQAESSGGGQLAFDSQRNLWLPDCFNHRVLRFPLVNGVRQTVADRVLGQADFTSMLANRGGQEVCADNSLYLGWAGDNVFVNGIAIDPITNDVYVGDTANRRVLRFPDGETTADLVLGQADFTHNDSGTGLDQMGPPAGLCINAAQTYLYVCDPQNHRILRYDMSSLSSGMDGELWASGIGWNLPMNVQYDPNHDSGELWVTDRQGPILKLVRESDGTLIRTKEPDAGGGGTGGSIGIDKAGNIFVTDMSYYYEDQVLLFRKADEGTPSVCTVYFPGGPAFSHNFSPVGITNTGVKHTMAVVPIGDQLITHDMGRVFYWNNRSSSLATGRPADGVLSPGTSVVTTFDVVNQGMVEFIWFTAEANGRYLWAIMQGSGSEWTRIVRWNLPVTNGALPDLKICADGYGHDGSWSDLPLLGGGIVQFRTGWGVTVTPNSSEMWITQQSENRAYRLRNPLAARVSDNNGLITYEARSIIDGRNSWTPGALVGATVVVGTAPNRMMMEIESNTAGVATGTTAWRIEVEGQFAWPIVIGGGHPTNGSGYHILPTVDTILGQADATGTSVNRGGAMAKNTLNKPGSCQLDAAGNLWISDFSLEAQGNCRLICFLKATIPSGQSSMIYGPNCDYVYPNVATWQPAFAPTGELVIAYSSYGPAPDVNDPIMQSIPPISREPGALAFQGRFPGIYNRPLDPAKFDANHERIGGPDGYLKDYQGTIGMAFHSDGTLYASDHNAHRILIYKAGFMPPITTPPPRQHKRDRGKVGHRTWF